ncbi:MAG: hypothetical protein QW587_04790 [Candidatus Bathyarchaeia archaeon]
MVKYRKLKGALGKELTAAIKLYLSQEAGGTDARTHTQAENGTILHVASSRTLESLRGVAKDVLSLAEKEIPQDLVERAIMNRVGGDSRTIEKYLRLLEAQGVLEVDRRISSSGRQDPKFIFRVHPDAADSIGRLR